MGTRQAPPRPLAGAALVACAALGALGSAGAARGQSFNFQDLLFRPEAPTAVEPVAAVIRGSGCIPAVNVERSGQRVDLVVGYDAVLPICGDDWELEVELGPLPAGDYIVRLLLDGFTFPDWPLRVYPALDRLVVEPHGRYQIEVKWALPTDFGECPGTCLPARPAFAVPISRVAGYFWFFSPDNPEITIKMLDGRALTGAYWLFLNATTSLEFTVTVERCADFIDPVVCTRVWSHQHQGGLPRPVFDLRVDPDDTL